MTVYRASERGNYVPPDCPRCGARVVVDWVYVGTSMDLDRWMPGRWKCPTPDCRGGARRDDGTPLSATHNSGYVRRGADETSTQTPTVNQ